MSDVTEKAAGMLTEDDVVVDRSPRFGEDTDLPVRIKAWSDDGDVLVFVNAEEADTVNPIVFGKSELVLVRPHEK